jgi:hypothetical protein
VFQILSVTCDNASNNDTMVEHLSTLVENFPGAANQTRCFSHILNLVAKSILRQFEVQKKGRNSSDSDYLDDATKALAVLAEELELDDGSTELADDEDEEEEDDKEGPDNERDVMSEEEAAELEESLVPIRLTLSKVKSFQTQPEIGHTVLTWKYSFAHSQTRSRTPPPSYSRSGLRSWRNLVSRPG